MKSLNNKVVKTALFFVILASLALIVHAIAPAIDIVTLTANDNPLNTSSANLTGFVNGTDGDGDNITFIHTFYQDGALFSTDVFINDADLQVYLPFNNDSLDYKNSYDTIGTIPTGGVGKVGNAAEFNNDAYYNLTNSASTLNYTENISVSAWFNLNDTGTHGCVVSDWNLASPYGWSICYLSSTQKLVVNQRTSGGTYSLESTTTIAADTWYHVGWSFEKGNQVLYLNSVNENEEFANLFLNTNDYPVQVGTRGTSATWYWGGLIDELQIYNRVLNSTEFEQLYKTSKYGEAIINSSSTSAGEEWILGGTACDSTSCSSETNSTTLTITQDPPTMISSRISPTTAYTNDTLIGFCNATDPDGDNLTYYYKWYKDDTLFSSGTAGNNFIWESDSTLVNGLTNLVAQSNPSLIYNFSGNEKFTIISGRNSGTFVGYTWNGTGWDLNSSLVTGLIDVGTNSKPHVFQNLFNNNEWDLITGKDDGTFDGYVWNGTEWISNSTIILGLTDEGTKSTSTPVQNLWGGNEYSLITGVTEGWGLNKGYLWNGSGWSENSTVQDGLSESFGIFNGDIAINLLGENKINLLGGASDSMQGYTWSGTSWVINNDVTNPYTGGNLPILVSSRASPTVIYNLTGNNKWSLIVGDSNGDFYGFSFNTIGNSTPGIELNVNNISSGSTLSSEEWILSCTVYDGTVNSTALNSSTLTISNSVPNQPTNIDITPHNPKNSDTLTCSFTQGTDLDTGDTLTDYIKWYNNSIEITTLENLTSIPSSNTGEGESWFCSVATSDGINTSSFINATQRTINSAPLILNSIINPSIAYANNTLYGFCNASDIDTDNLRYYYNWYLNGQLNSSGSTFEFIQDDDIISGINSTGSSNAPEGFILNETNKLIIGNNAGTFSGFEWDGINWTEDNSIVLGLADVGLASRPHVFNISNTLNLISGKASGGGIDYRGYTWNGSQWNSNSTLETGLGSDDNIGQITTWEDSGIIYALTTDTDGDNTGYIWNGAGWSSNSTAIAGISTLSFASYSKSLEIDGQIKLIRHETSSTYKGYDWNGSGWISNNTFIGDLGNEGSSTGFGIFKEGSVHRIITSTGVGVFQGFVNGYNQSVQVNVSTLSNDLVTQQQWVFECLAYDGVSNSTFLNSSILTISNTIPTHIINITPDPTQNSQDLTVNITFDDADGNNTWTANETFWYNNSIEVISLRNLTSIDAGNTSLGENWTVQVRVYDGENFSVALNDSVIIVDLLPPTINSLSVDDNTPLTTETITFTADLTEPDSNLTSTSCIFTLRKSDFNGGEGLGNPYNQTTTNIIEDNVSFDLSMAALGTGTLEWQEAYCTDTEGNTATNSSVGINITITAPAGGGGGGGSSSGGSTTIIVSETVTSEITIVKPFEINVTVNVGNRLLKEFEILNLQQVESAVNIGIDKTLTSPEAVDWLFFDSTQGRLKSLDQLLLPPTGSEIEQGRFVRYVVEVPKDTPLGNYTIALLIIDENDDQNFHIINIAVKESIIQRVAAIINYDENMQLVFIVLVLSGLFVVTLTIFGKRKIGR